MEWFNWLWTSTCDRWQYFWLERATDPWFLIPTLAAFVFVVLVAWGLRLFRFQKGVTAERAVVIALFVLLVIVLGYRGLFGLVLLCHWSGHLKQHKTCMVGMAWVILACRLVVVLQTRAMLLMRLSMLQNNMPGYSNSLPWGRLPI